MNPVPNLVPYLPENAPFTPEQRAYLNGFLAGLFARAPVPVSATPPAVPTPTPLLPLAILFGSQTGNAENLARRAAKEAGKRGFAATLHDLARVTPAQLSAERHALVVTSTFGDGEPPDNARAFWAALRADAAPRLESLRYSLCALGDSNYPKFCGFGRELDERLGALGARCVTPRVECDVEFKAAFLEWLPAALTALAAGARGGSEASAVGAVAHVSGEPRPLTPSLSPGGGEGARRAGEGESGSVPLSPTNKGQPATYSRQRPFPSRLRTNRRLNGPGSEKDVRHFEFDLSESGPAYEVGDALGVQPENHPALVDELLDAMGGTGEEPVPGRDGSPAPFREALLRHYEITRIPTPLLQAFAERTGDDELRRVTRPEANGDLSRFLQGREIIDLIHAHRDVRMTPTELVGCLRKLQPRLYSISSSPKAHPGEVHLTVAAVRYQSLGRARRGVCSTYLADCVDAGTPVPVFVHRNPAFRPPPPDRDLIMVGPGTGIAPFRAFLEERLAIGATGRNWLFFGGQHAATDFLYADEIAAFERAGILTRLDLAWSRDQATKDYVQHRMLERAAELWSWIDAGASFHVCGDARRMAVDVDSALHEVIVRGGGKTPDEAVACVAALRSEGRYRRDVY